MKTSSKLSIALPVVVLLIMVFCLVVAGEYRKTAINSNTGPVVSQTGRVPAFSIITIKGRAFAAQKPGVSELSEETTFSSTPATEQKTSLFPMAYKLISRGLIFGK